MSVNFQHNVTSKFIIVTLYKIDNNVMIPFCLASMRHYGEKGLVQFKRVESLFINFKIIICLLKITSNIYGYNMLTIYLLKSYPVWKSCNLICSRDSALTVVWHGTRRSTIDIVIRASCLVTKIYYYFQLWGKFYAKVSYTWANVR